MPIAPFISFSPLLILEAVLPAAAQNHPPLQRQPVLEASIPAANPPIRLVHGARIRLAPNQPTDCIDTPFLSWEWWRKGTSSFNPRRTVQDFENWGQLFEPAGKTILHFDNASSTDHATIVAYLLDGLH